MEKEKTLKELFEFIENKYPKHFKDGIKTYLYFNTKHNRVNAPEIEIEVFINEKGLPKEIISDLKKIPHDFIIKHLHEFVSEVK